MRGAIAVDVRWSLALTLVFCGCGDVGFERPGSDAARESSLPDAMVSRDATTESALPKEDAMVRMDARTPDADVPDAMVDGAAPSCDDGVQNQGEVFVDSGGPCSFRAPACGEGVDPWTLGLFTFQDVTATTVNDEQNAGDGTIRSGPASYVSSAPGCAMAWRGNGSVSLVAPNVAAWKQATGSLDFILRVPDMAAETAMQVPFSRDAQGSADGHIVVAVTPTQRLVVRFQSTVAEVYRCSPVLAAGDWVHIGINWGAPDLEVFVDGSEADFVGNVPFSSDGDIVSCTDGALSLGFNGNDEPWVFGANQWTSTAGTADSITQPLKSAAAIDHVRISSVRRDFTR